MTILTTSFSFVLFTFVAMIDCSVYQDLPLDEGVSTVMKTYVKPREWRDQHREKYRVPYADKENLNWLGRGLSKDGKVQIGMKNRRYENEKRSLQALAKNADFPKKPNTHHSQEYVTNYSYPAIEKPLD